jgi:hypothetical protein
MGECNDGLSGCPVANATSLYDAKTLLIDFGEKTGKKLMPINGLCNGPVSQNGRLDLSAYYAELGTPYVRLHDTDGMAHYMVDISNIFTNFDVDEDDPKNYFFHNTDQLLDAIHKLGAGTIYRLGESIDHGNYKRYARAPKDFNKWARICRNIVRHYNEGWADGFHLDIEYWEIWNEPDLNLNDWANNAMWSESDPYAFHDLYIITSKLLKKEFPLIKIGGYAATSLVNEQQYNYFVRFLDRVKTEGAPLDFFSWHIYTLYHDVSSLSKSALIARQELDKRGFTHTLSILDEWNTTAIADESVNIWSVLLQNSDIESFKVKKIIFENMKNMIGASFCASHFIIMNDLPIDIAAYYDGQPKSTFCGLFDIYAIPQKTYYAFKAYGELYKNDRERVQVDGQGNNIWCIANQSMAMIASYGVGGDIEVTLKNPPSGCKKVEIYMLDDNLNLELARTEELKATIIPVKLRLKEHMVVLIKLVGNQKKI